MEAKVPEQSLRDFDAEQAAIELSHKCPDCHGSGHFYKYPCYILKEGYYAKCQTCDGTGYVE